MPIAQRPLQGAVWNGKATYQLKKKGGVFYRLNVVLNRSTSVNDTIGYNSDLLQVSGSYSSKQWMGLLSLGQSNQTIDFNGQAQPDSLYPAHQRTTFLMATGSKSLSNFLRATIGADVGFAPYGFSKWGLNGGLNYSISKVPLTLRASARYSAYRLKGYSGNIATDINGVDKGEPMDWRKLLSGSLELVWQFKMKLNR